MKSNHIIPDTIKQEFSQIIEDIKLIKQKIYMNINHNLIELYWNTGKIISNKVNSSQWGKAIVSELAKFITRKEPTIKGFSDKNLWRMKQFYETYQGNEKLIQMSKKIPWTHNTIIFSRCKSIEEQKFYLNLTKKERYSTRELERQIETATFERTHIGNKKLSAVMRELHPTSNNTFKDNYVLEFMGLPLEYNENDLQKSLIKNMKKFILELGRDFIFIDEEYRIQVGNSDFFIDLLFFHRGLAALIAFEIKIEKFKPEHLGQLSFYLEALDRDVKKEHENPSIGILLCSDKDDEVVEYALNRHLSPTMISQYTTLLPDKRLLQNKLHEINTLVNNISDYDK